MCTAYNKHGSNTQTTFFNVLYKPECGITQTEVSGKVVLICTATANPAEVDFTWKVKNENETIEDNVEKVGLQSFLTLETRVENVRTYLCYANNSVGSSIPCERDVTGNVGWWHRFENENLMILLAVIAGTILMVIIICIIIIIVCRRKRAADKCPNPSATKDKSDLNSSPSDALLQTDPDNKAFYENLPFHGMQNPPNKPFRPEFSDLDYADVDYRSYGPINYKAASIYAAQRGNQPDDDEELL
uniref:Ig-like domain-containing protein n=1 Tax=Graphocephala atropunctata TaxID=36148 RepID=A0A1B6LS03_9HEMI